MWKLVAMVSGTLLLLFMAAMILHRLVWRLSWRIFGTIFGLIFSKWGLIVLIVVLVYWFLKGNKNDD